MQDKRSRFSLYWFPIKGGGVKDSEWAYPFKLHVSRFSRCWFPITGGGAKKICSGPTRSSCMSGRSHALFNNSDQAAAHLDRLMRLGSVGNESQNIYNLFNDICFWFRLIQKSLNRSPVSRLLRFPYFERSGAIAPLSSSHGPPLDARESAVRPEGADQWPALFPMRLPVMPRPFALLAVHCKVESSSAGGGARLPGFGQST